MALLTSNTSKLQLTTLDFNTLKQSFLSFLASQNTFADYNFAGSGLNTLVDLLIYNSHYMLIYLNAIANETFLDTAVLRSTVVSHAKELGYTPRSVTSAVATVNVALYVSNTANTPPVVTMPRFTSFVSDALNGTAYSFVTTDDYTTTISGNTYLFSNVALTEGSPTVKTFIVDNSNNPLQYFDIIDQNVDTSTVKVIVQISTVNQQQFNYILAESFTDVLTANSNVYFIQEGTNGNYQIYFGDGVIGNQLDDGNIVIVSYLISSGNNANGLDTFALNSQILASATSNVSLVAASAGGSPIEDVNSIKFNAPKAYAAQNRAVTVNDYVALINKNYPYFDAVTVWGGENLTPPVYGQVYFSVKPKAGYGITLEQQQYIINQVIQPISVLTVLPVYVPVDYNYLVNQFVVQYDSSQTSLYEIQIVNNINAAILNYANLNFNTFNAEFYISRLLRAVDDSDGSILASSTTVWIEKRLQPTLNVSATYTMNIGVPLHHGATVSDMLYTSPSFTTYDLSGTSRLCYVEETPESYSGVEQVAVLSPGSGYIVSPTLKINGDGSGANAYAIIVNGTVSGVVVDNPGSEYSTATVTAVGGGGTGATFSALLQGNTGTLRTYYFDQLNNKVILNANAGIIDYANGSLTMNNFAPTAVSDSTGTIKFRVQPDTTWFGSTRELIITIDPTDQTAISVDLIDINDV